MALLAGDRPAATHFSLLRQRKVSKRKATRSLGPLRFATGQPALPVKNGGPRKLASLRCAQTARGPDPVFPDHHRPSQNGWGGRRQEAKKGARRFRYSSFSPWEKVGMRALRIGAHRCKCLRQTGFMFVEVKACRRSNSAGPHPRLLPGKKGQYASSL